MKVYEIAKEVKSFKGELYLIEGNLDILNDKKLYEEIKNKEVLYAYAEKYNDGINYISVSYDYGKMYDMSYILIKRTKDGVVAVGDKAMSCVSSYFPQRRYETLSLDATKVFKNDYFVVGFVGTAFVDIDKKCISIEDIIKKLLKETKTIKDFVEEFKKIYNNMKRFIYIENAEYSFYLVDKNNALIYNFKYQNKNEDSKTIEDGFLFNTPVNREVPDIKEIDTLEEIAEKFKNAIAHTHENQKRELDDTFSVSKESDVVFLRFEGDKR